MARRIIALLTDFGLSDPFVGVMKGVIKSIAPKADLIDLTHGIPPQDIAAGAYALADAAGYFPRDSIFLAVVDPGVGSARQPVALRAGGRYYVGPDNGLFSQILMQSPKARAVALDNPRFHLDRVSKTFHGRDIFAPAAAWLARGKRFSALGSPTHLRGSIDLPAIVWGDREVSATVVRRDHFGNLVTNLRQSDWRARRLPQSGVAIEIGGRQIAEISPSYASVPLGDPLAYWGSSGWLEIGVRNGDALSYFAAALQQQVRVSWS